MARRACQLRTHYCALIDAIDARKRAVQCCELCPNDYVKSSGSHARNPLESRVRGSVSRIFRNIPRRSRVRLFAREREREREREKCVFEKHAKYGQRSRIFDGKLIFRPFSFFLSDLGTRICAIPRCRDCIRGRVRGWNKTRRNKCSKRRFAPFGSDFRGVQLPRMLGARGVDGQ